MKQKIKTYLETDRGFSSGKQLYGISPGKSLAFNNALNRMNDTPGNCAKLHYELAKIAGITERHLGIIMRNPVVEASEEKEVKVIADETVKVKKLTFGKGIKGLAAIKAFAKEKGIEVEGKKRADYDKDVDAWYEINLVKLQAALEKATAIKQFTASTELDKQSVKLHDQFPFLSEDDCPDVFKILTNELAVSYRKYKAAHPRLFEQLTADERLEAAKDVVVPYKENKAIWNELAHYQTNRKPLGEHPLVIAYLRQLEIKEMDAAQLAKLQSNISNNINRNKKALEKLEGKKADDKAALITSQETELRIVEVELKTR